MLNSKPMIFGLLPVKAFHDAKQRLGALLTAEERAELARVMFEHALDVLLRAPGLDRVVVASSEAAVLQHAAGRGALTLPETTQNGHSASADWAARRCMEMGARTLLMVPIDVPLLTVDDIQAVLAAGTALAAPSLVIVPSADGTGTNALLRTPPDVIQSRFGPGSFRLHLEQAAAREASVAVVRPEGLVFDVDTPEDASAWLTRGGGGLSREMLHRLVARRSMAASGEKHG